MLLDPCLASAVPKASSQRRLNGSTASLGVLMGHAFRRSSGRGWRLRQLSMALWPSWVSQLDHPTSPLSLQTPLVQLAASEDEAEREGACAFSRSQRCLQRPRHGRDQATGLCCPNRMDGWILLD